MEPGTNIMSVRKRSSSIHSSVISVAQPQERLFSKTSWIQIGYGFWVHQVQVVVGMAFGYSATTLPLLADMRDTAKAQPWILYTLILVMIPIGCLLCGYLIDVWSRRTVMVICPIPMTVGLLYLELAKDTPHVVIARMLTGCGVSMATIPPWIYCAEISLPKMRAILACMPNFTLAIGIAFKKTVLQNSGHVYFICVVYCFLVMISHWYLPETPYSVLMRRNMARVERAVKTFRAKDYNSMFEVDDLRSFRFFDRIRRSTHTEAVAAGKRSDSDPAQRIVPAFYMTDYYNCKERMNLMVSRGAYLPFTLILTFVLFAQLTGFTIVIYHADEMLQEINSVKTLWSNYDIMNVTRICAGLVLFVFLYTIGRRYTAMPSVAIMGVTFIGLGLYLMRDRGTTISSLICFIIYTIAGTFTFTNIPMIMMVAVVPLGIRGILSSILFSLHNCAFLMMEKTYPLIKISIGLSWTIIVFGCVALLCFIFLNFALPVAAVCTLQDFQEYYRGLTSTLGRSSLLVPSSKSLIFKTISSKETMEKEELPLRARSVSIRFKLDEDKDENKEATEDKETVAGHAEGVGQNSKPVSEHTESVDEHSKSVGENNNGDSESDDDKNKNQSDKKENK